MADNKFSCCSSDRARPETLCIDTNRVLDSCRDRDCFEDVRVILTDFGNEIIERTTNVRVKCAYVAWTNISIEQVRFNRGFYAVTIKFFIKLYCEACLQGGRVEEFEGICAVEKKVIRYGGESNVSIFRSNGNSGDFCSVPEICNSTKNVPIAICEVVDPIILSAKVREPHDPCCCCCCCCADIPCGVANQIQGTLCDNDNGCYLTVTLGLFSVIRLVRPAQFLVQGTEYIVPDKECLSAEDDDPCSLFNNMAFPAGEFSTSVHAPCKSEPSGGKCGC